MRIARVRTGNGPGTAVDRGAGSGAPALAGRGTVIE